MINASMDMDGKFSIKGTARLKVSAEYMRFGIWKGVIVETRYKKKMKLRVYLSMEDAQKLYRELDKAIVQLTKEKENAEILGRLEI